MTYRLMYVFYGLAIVFTGINVVKDLIGPGRWAGR